MVVLHPEGIPELQTILGIEDKRAQDDFKIFFMSAYDRYADLKPTYVARNVSFLIDSIFVTLSHATSPKRNPSGFGLSLGSFAGFLKKGEDSQACKMIFSNEMSINFMKKIMDLFKKVEGFDTKYFGDLFVKMNISLLEPDELQRFNAVVESL
jgi:hypothetical protein